MAGVIFILNAYSCSGTGQHSTLHPARVAFNRKSFSQMTDKVAGFFEHSGLNIVYTQMVGNKQRAFVMWGTMETQP